VAGKEIYTYYDEAGRAIHVFEDEDGNQTEVIEYNMADYIFMGEQWCPYCLSKIRHDEENEFWVCDICGYNITDEEIEEDGGVPSLGAALDKRNDPDFF